MLSTILTDLPPLKKVLNKREAHVTPSVLKWFKENISASSAIEVKATNKNTIPEKALQPHQRRALLAAKYDSITHKIADNRTRLPFDAFMLCKSEAFVVACFTKHGVCLVFDVDDWHGSHFNDEANVLFKIPLTPSAHQ